MELGNFIFFHQNFDFQTHNFVNFLKNSEVKWNPNSDLIADYQSFNIVLLRKKKKIQRIIHLKQHFFKSELSCIDFRWRPNFPSLAILGRNQEECFAPCEPRVIRTCFYDNWSLRFLHIIKIHRMDQPNKAESMVKVTDKMPSTYLRKC